jgi:putative hemolysin
MWADLAIILGLILANSVFSAAEIALVTARASRLKELAGRGDVRAQRVLNLRQHPERLLATVQVGLTVLSSLAAALGGARVAAELASLIGPWMTSIPLLGDQSARAPELALGVVVGLVSYVSLVVGELIPKSLAMRHAEFLALWLSQPVLWLEYAGRPVVWFLTASSNLLLRPFGDRTSFTESRVNVEELRVMIDEASRSGSLDPRSGDIASRALDFSQLRAGEVCVPRARLKTLDITASQAEVLRVFCEDGYHRMPVVDETPDHVVGYVTAGDVLTSAHHQQLLVLHDLIRPALFVPENTLAPQLLKMMQEKKQRMAMVVDEHGGLVGMVTEEDLFEELVGEFHDEGEPAQVLVKELSAGRYSVAGMTPLRDLERTTGMRLPDDLTAETVAGVVLMLAGEIPSAGSSFDGYGATWQVTARTERRVKQVEVTLLHGQQARRSTPTSTPQAPHD